MKFTKKDTIIDILNQNPLAHDIMIKKGLHCIGCGGAAFESLEDGARAHGLDEKEIDQMVEQINKIK